MTRNRPFRIDSNYIFYICLSAVLAAAVFGLLTDVAGR
jgi:hypothetical protein